MNELSIIGETVVTPGGAYADGVVNIRNGKIVGVGPAREERPLRGAEILRCDGQFILPGFVDIHVHGALGYDTMANSYEALDKISRFYASHGTTSLLMTTISSPIDELIKTVASVKETMERGVSGSEILGVHIEGPYYIYEQRGCHAPRFLRTPSPSDYLPLLDSGKGVIRMMSFSPELEGALDLTRALVARGVVASMGHTNASYDQVTAAVEAGVTHCVHLYCAMGTVHQCRPEERPNTEFIPGATEAVLDNDSLTAEIISDGVHVHPTLIRLLLRCKGLEKTVLVTDAMHATGLGDGEYVFGGMRIRVRDEVARTEDGILASSTKPMDYMLRRFCEFTSLPVVEGVEAASLTPSRVVGLEEMKGSLEKGKDADIVVMDRDFTVHATYVKGRLVYQKE